MKYEFIFKVKENNIEGYKQKYRVVVEAARFNSVKLSYEKVKKEHPKWDSIILINELDDFNEFIRVIQ